MNKPKVLCFGELLYRIQGVDSLFSNQQCTIEMFPGGSEANVAIALAQLNIHTHYMSAAPDNVLVDRILDVFKENNVDVSLFIKEGRRLGSYILLDTNGLTNGEVIYDREFSSFSQLEKGKINWDDVFENIDWFHWSAITPSLNGSLALLCEEALIAAQRRNIKISVDLNYRSKLWQYGKTALDVMPELVRYCDLIMGNIWASNKMLGTSMKPAWSGDRSTLDYTAISKSVAAEIFKDYSKCKDLAFTYRFMDNPKHNLFYATYHKPNKEDYVSKVFETNELLDRIGSGDAFMAGIIAAMIKDYSPKELIDFATELGFKKLFVKGDFIKI